MVRVRTGVVKIDGLRCVHRSGNHCAVAAQIAGLPTIAIASDAACRVCEANAAPRSKNKVTCDLAIATLYQAGRPEEALAIVAGAPHIYGSRQSQPERLAAIEAGTGVGSQIWRLLAEIGVQHDPRCDCLGWAEKLNAWGVAGCRLARGEIVEHLQTARREYGWARSILAAARAVADAVGDLAAGRHPWLNPLDPYGSLVDEGIRRAEAASVPSIPAAP